MQEHKGEAFRFEPADSDQGSGGSFLSGLLPSDN
jgi:hypothetical protein